MHEGNNNTLLLFGSEEILPLLEYWAHTYLTLDHYMELNKCCELPVDVLLESLSAVTLVSSPFYYYQGPLAFFLISVLASLSLQLTYLAETHQYYHILFFCLKLMLKTDLTASHHTNYVECSQSVLMF